MLTKLEAYFDAAFAAPQGIKRLRELILTLAVQGKLVEQNPADEPACELLKKIAAEKAALEQEGKIKKQKPLPPVSAAEKPYALPIGWEWVRLGEVVLSSDAGWSPQCLSHPRQGKDWGVLKVSAVSWGVFKPEENKTLPPGNAVKHECAVRVGDFLISRANTDELVARSVLVENDVENLLLSDKIVRLSLSYFLNKYFINLVNHSFFARQHYVKNASGTSSSMKNVSRETMFACPLPLPPLAEQHRIVAKVDALMRLCDAVETQLEAQTATQTRLLDAVMAAV